jgi:hypothetical protein
MSEYHAVARGCLVVFLGSLGCGPSLLETGADTSGSTDDAGTSATSAGADTQATTGSLPTTSPPGETDSTGEPQEPTTGEPLDCPKGQTPFASPLGDGARAAGVRQLGTRLDDGDA